MRIFLLNLALKFFFKFFSVPMAVGTMNVSTKLLQPGSPCKGIAANIIHVFGVWVNRNYLVLKFLKKLKLKHQDQKMQDIKEVESLEKEQLTTAGKKLHVYFH